MSLCKRLFTLSSLLVLAVSPAFAQTPDPTSPPTPPAPPAPPEPPPAPPPPPPPPPPPRAPTTAPTPAADDTAPLHFKIGSAYFTPLGFMDFTGVWRSKDGGSGI